MRNRAALNNAEEEEHRQLAIFEELKIQSDRGIAIVGAACVEESLTAAIHSFLHEDKQAAKRLFDVSGPLAAFSAKIDLASMLGMTSRRIKSDLHSIRGIRNEFAHQVMRLESLKPPSFTTPSIADRCMGLSCIAHQKYPTPKDAYIQACINLYFDFELLVTFGQKAGDPGRVVAIVERAA